MSAPNPRSIAMANGFKAVVESLKQESERGTIVLAAAWLDESLTKIISKYLKPITASKETLLKAGQPLGDFGTKILLADRLNLVHPSLISSLSLCRKLRNEFAHLSSDLSFNTPHVKDRVDLLFHLNEDLLTTMGSTLVEAGMIIDMKNPESISAKDMLGAFGPKQLFHYTCGLINSALAVIEYDIEPSKPMFEVTE